MKTIYQLSIFSCIIILAACNQNNKTVVNNDSSSYQTNEAQPTEERSTETSKDGTYRYSDSSSELSISISGTSWYGTTTIKSGYGQEYDNQNAQSDSGIIKGTDLYDSSGMVKIGYVDGNSLTTSIGGNSVTLNK